MISPTDIEVIVSRETLFVRNNSGLTNNSNIVINKYVRFRELFLAFTDWLRRYA